MSCASQRQIPQAQVSNEPKQVTRTLRTKEPCIDLSLADCENFRAYGTSVSYIESVALSEAERDARARLANMIKVAVEGAALDYQMNANSNNKISSEQLGEVIMKHFVSEKITNTKIIENSIYDRSDGSIQVYVCIEMRDSKEDIKEGINDYLKNDERIKIEFDRERFIDKMFDELEKYKENNK